MSGIRTHNVSGEHNYIKSENVMQNSTDFIFKCLGRPHTIYNFKNIANNAILLYCKYQLFLVISI